MAKVNLSVNCPDCNKDFMVQADLTSADLAPTVRSKINPIGDILVYKTGLDNRLRGVHIVVRDVNIFLVG